LSIAQLDINGNPYIGVFCAANDDFALIPKGLGKKEISKIEKVLEVKSIQLSIAGSRLIGSLLALNSHGAVVNKFTETSELLLLKKHTNVTVLEEKLNAIGNNVLTNNHGALVHKQFSKNSLKQIEDALDVEILKGTIAGLRTIGTAAAITDRGGLCHPKVKNEDLDFLTSFFKVEIIIGTANYGTPLVGACVLANSKGAVTGTSTTGIELGRIEDGLKLIN
jgi:translation initiation factor 6